VGRETLVGGKAERQSEEKFVRGDGLGSKSRE